MTGEGSLPRVADGAAFDAVRRDEKALRPGVDALLRRLGVRGREVERFATGTQPVYGVGGDLVLKLFPPIHREDAATETAALSAVGGRLPVPVPAVREAGEFDGWAYVLMDRLTGLGLADVWDEIPRGDRLRLAGALGETLAALHEIPAPELGPPDWTAWIEGRRENAEAHHRADGLAEEWVRQVPGFLDAVPLCDTPPVLLHTEIMREHLLVADGPGGWRLTGLFDFEPAMRGDREYEFAAVGIFVAAGDAGFLRTLLLAYGHRPADLDDDLRRRFLAHTLLHRYSSLDWYLGLLPVPGPRTLDALATSWFAT
ncbi:phosphotransferase family protein [Bailinhaonella thermotolerans]|uniref:Aminoglycoside phosphotransferase family protein n=1 Tax=Bailinhaonella thermotolerans TaxID=1070861 RepID=A0A3A4AF19_9ACTN|nr:aminoglycoside 3'-phosphotransferase/choline kinase family protein [Bailinhaonella thermotolerans]RJL24243.1 aminoglycoside phosphotransferase family protein [Bailinhaonella thermotolerans]